MSYFREVNSNGAKPCQEAWKQLTAAPRLIVGAWCCRLATVDLVRHLAKHSLMVFVVARTRIVSHIPLTNIDVHARHFIL
jgi:hypothetical protein